jgi:hypothetical protein
LFLSETLGMLSVLETIGTALRSLRLAKGLAQDALAKASLAGGKAWFQRLRGMS